MKYIKELDGLRALSIFLVFIFHLDFELASIGWAGVNIFFVLSGFLITGILLESKGREDYFKRFYIRRSLRIFPIYYLVVILFSVFIYVGFGEHSHLLALFTYTQNFPIAFSESSKILSVLGHTWTLAIEEQFYLIFPLIIYFLSEKYLKVVLVVLCIITPMLRILLIDSNYPFLQSTLLISQMDALFLGAILALLYRYNDSHTIKILGRISFISGLLLFLLILFKITQGTKLIDYWNGYKLFANPNNYLSNPLTVQIFTAVDLLALSLIIFVIQDRGFFKKLFGSRPLVHIGQISYGIYLFHWPVIFLLSKFFNTYGEFNIIVVILSMGLTYVISLFSYTYFESYFLRLKEKF